MRYFYLIFFILIIFFCTGFAEKITSYRSGVDGLESVFKAHMPLKQGILYTKVPRGLILSIDEKVFFNLGEAAIKESSLYILDVIAAILQELPNYCVIESHTQEDIPQESLYREKWELSTARAQNIAQYMTVCGKINKERLFPIGFAEYMPFKGNVFNNSKGFDNRVDFVIIEYEVRR